MVQGISKRLLLIRKWLSQNLGKPFLYNFQWGILKRRRRVSFVFKISTASPDLYEEIMQQMQLFKNQISVFHIATALCTFRTQVVLQHII
jgi:hypothetical protein